MKKLLLYIVLTMLFIVVVGYYSNNKGTLPLGNFPSPTEQSQSYVVVGEEKILVEIADSNKEREVGLSKHDSLSEGRGMLFVFENQDRVRKFWMKDMKFPIDIIWIDNNKIAEITKNVPTPQPETSDENLTTYSSDTLVDYVLEVPAGYSDEKGFEVGDEVEISF